MSDWQSALATGLAGFLGSLQKAGNESLEPDAPPPDAPPIATGKDARVFGPPAREPEAMSFDPYSWYSGSSEFHTRRFSLSYDTERRMAAAPPLSAIIKRRCEDVAEYCQPEENPYLPGFALRMRNRKASPSRAAVRMMAELTRFIEQCGVITDGRQALTRDDLPTFAKKVIRDSLRHDQLNFEVVPSKIGRAMGGKRPAMFVATPAHTMRLAINDRDGHGLADDDHRTPRYVQVYEEMVVNEFTPSEMCFAVRNPRSDLEVCGYGYSELEMLVSILTAWLNAFDRNHKFFTQGVGIPGILNLKGAAVNEKIMRAFKRELQMLVSGVANSHRLPVTSAEGMEFIDLHSNNKDMEYSQWIDMLTKLACAIFSMDPAEIGFNFGNTGQTSSMGAADQVAKITESRDRGLKPLVKFLFAQLNRYVVQQLDPDFELVAQGLRSTSESDDIELDTKRLNSYMMVDQVRALRDMPPMENGTGKCILSPAWIQFQSAQQQSGAGGGDGQPAPDDGAESPDMGGMFDAPPGATPPPADDPNAGSPDQGAENADAGSGAPPMPVVQSQAQGQPLAASLTSSRRPRVSSFTL